MSELIDVHAHLRAALEPLGVEVGSEVLALWRDRERRGQQPLPAEALRRLAEFATSLMRQAD